MRSPGSLIRSERRPVEQRCSFLLTQSCPVTRDLHSMTCAMARSDFLNQDLISRSRDQIRGPLSRCPGRPPLGVREMVQEIVAFASPRRREGREESR